MTLRLLAVHAQQRHHGIDYHWLALSPAEPDSPLLEALGDARYFQLDESKVDTTMPESDLFAGVEER